jgi:putrescine transport system substrate-binding protein
MTRALLVPFLLLAALAPARADDAHSLNVTNWSDYIAPGVIPAFEKQTGIHVTYDTYDSNDTLDAKLKAGHSGYDIAVPSLTPYLAQQIKAGIYRPLDKSKLPNASHLDPAILAKMTVADPGNAHAIPWMTGTNGIGFNVDKVHAIMPDAPTDSLALLFDPAIVSKFKDCGVSFLDSQEDAIPEALIYLHLDPNDQDPADIAKAVDLFARIRPYIRKFDSSGYINDLANGDLCVAFGYSTDIKQAARRAREANRGVRVQYRIPTEGAQYTIDSMAILADAPHPDNALKFLDFVMQPAIAAQSENFLFAQSGVDAPGLIDPAVADDPGIVPPPAVMAHLYTPRLQSAAVRRVFTRAWTRIKTGQ